MEYRNIRIGDVLKEFGYITEEQVQEALAYSRENGVKIGAAMIALKFITERQMLEALAKRQSLPMIDLSDTPVDIDAVIKIPRNIAEKNCVLAIAAKNGVLTVVTNDPTNFYGLEDIHQLTGMYIEIGLAEQFAVERAIQYYYAEIDAKKAAVKANQEFALAVEQIETEDNDDTPVSNLIDSLVTRAYNISASDIHIEPFEHQTKIRMRVDGTLNDFVTINKNIHPSLIARIKIMAELDIAEKHVPQDGHFRVTYDGLPINIRVSLIPTVFGEKAVMRLLESNSKISNDDKFGMAKEDYLRFCEMLKSPNGIIYITGPTGSGKSTTLYMILANQSQKHINISTIEDPVEKNLEGVNQMQVNVPAGLTFESGLRALMRQDPDIIMVGETRDQETASISIRAAITGHIVFSTLHTNDAASSIVRLVDMGVERYLLANSLTGIVAQRLVKKLCPYCKEKGNATKAEREFVGKDVEQVVRAKGCHLCNYTGYQGRIAIHEILLVDKIMREMIARAATTEEIKDYAASRGMHTLKESGVALVLEGLTTVEELMKVAYYA